MYQIVSTKKLKKGFRKLIKSKKITRKEFEEVVTILANGKKLEARLQDHELKGEYSGHRECHIRPDTLLIYRIESRKTMFLYHLVPENMTGNILYPLNKLKKHSPELYKNEVQKYESREYLLTQVIPHLNCLWNDVLHFSAVHPSEIIAALKEAGGNPKPVKAYKIPAELLLGENTIVYLYAQRSPKEKLNPKNFVPFRVEDLPSYTAPPNATKTYYRETFAQDKRPLLFHRVPHILYKGSINTADFEIISS